MKAKRKQETDNKFMDIALCFYSYNTNTINYLMIHINSLNGIPWQFPVQIL